MDRVSRCAGQHRTACGVFLLEEGAAKMVGDVEHRTWRLKKPVARVRLQVHHSDLALTAVEAVILVVLPLHFMKAPVHMARCAYASTTDNRTLPVISIASPFHTKFPERFSRTSIQNTDEVFARARCNRVSTAMGAWKFQRRCLVAVCQDAQGTGVLCVPRRH